MKTNFFYAAFLAVTLSLVGCDMDNDHDMAPVNDPTYPATPTGDIDGVGVDIDADSPIED